MKHLTPKTKPFYKINFEDLNGYYEFLDLSDKDLGEFMVATFRYYEETQYAIKSKKVQKAFNLYKKTMDHIMQSKQYGVKGAIQKTETQQVESDTLEGSLVPPLEGSLEAPLPVNNKVLSIKDKELSIKNELESIKETNTISEAEKTASQPSKVLGLNENSEPKEKSSAKKEKVEIKGNDYSKFIDAWRLVEIEKNAPAYNFSATPGKDAANGTKIVKLIKTEIEKSGKEFPIDDTLKHFLDLAYKYFKTWQEGVRGHKHSSFTPSMCLSQYNQIMSSSNKAKPKMQVQGESEPSEEQKYFWTYGHEMPEDMKFALSQ